VEQLAQLDLVEVQQQALACQAAQEGQVVPQQGQVCQVVRMAQEALVVRLQDQDNRLDPEDQEDQMDQEVQEGQEGQVVPH